MRKIFEKSHIHPTFLIFLSYFIFSHNLPYFLTFLASVLTHEFGHYYVAKKRGYKLDNFYLAPYGACLNYKEKVFESRDELMIAFAGPCINLVLSVSFVCLWWIFPSLYNFTYDFVFQSVILALINLLPCYPLDGGRVMVGLFSQNSQRARVIKVLKVLNYIFSGVFFILFIASCFINFNPSFALIGGFLLMGNLDFNEEGKYQISIIKNRAKNFSKPMFIYVYEDVCIKELLCRIEQNKHTIFILELSEGKTQFLDENKVKALALAYPLTMSLGEIVKQGRA